MASVWERFRDRCIEKIVASGGTRWDATDPRRVYPFTASELEALRAGLKSGALETAYDHNGDLVIRGPMLGPAPPRKEPADAGLGYAETPALLAMRARRRALGR
jgi:hypothetical protein